MGALELLLQLTCVMPKPLHSISDFALQQLKIDLQEQYGILVKSRAHCEDMSTSIDRSKKIKISSSTLGRLFLSDNKSHHFYLSTLDELVKAIGQGASWECYQNDQDNLLFQKSTLGWHGNDLNNSLFAKNIAHRTWKPITDWMSDFSAFSDQSEYLRFKHAFGFGLYGFLVQHPQYQREVLKRFSVFPFFQESFLELNNDPDYQLEATAVGYELYLKDMVAHNKDDLNKRIFAASNICLGLFKNGNSLFRRKATKMIADYSGCEEELLAIHPFNFARYHLIHLLMQWDKEQKISTQYEDSFFSFLQIINRERSDWEVRIVYFVLLDNLLLLDMDDGFIQRLIAVSPWGSILSGRTRKDQWRSIRQYDVNSLRWRKYWESINGK